MSIVKLINFKNADNIFIWDYWKKHDQFTYLFEFLIQSEIDTFKDEEIIEVIIFKLFLDY